MKITINRTKLLVLTGFFFLVTHHMFARGNEKGIDLYRAEFFDAAKSFFLQQTNQSGLEKAENYYYLGQVYFQLNQLDSAAYFFTRATETLPDYPFGYIGSGSLELKKGNTRAAEDFFKKANNFARKNPAIQTAIAEAYVNAGDYGNAIIALDRARRINNKYSGIYIVEGDMMMKQGKIGDACGRYENAILFNNTDKLAYLKLAQVYRGIKLEIALKYLDQLIALDPNYIPAYVIIGDINREIGMYNKALDAYERFIHIPGIPLVQHERYAQLLFFTQQFQKALDQIKYVITHDPENLVMKRLEAYNSFRMENHALGLEQIIRFLEAMPQERHIYQDYTTLAQLAMKEKKMEKAMEAYLRLFEIDAEKAIEDRIHKEMANIAYASGDYADAITYFEKYFETATAPDAADYFLYGQSNYNTGIYYVSPENLPAVGTPEAEAELKKIIAKGDKAYTEVIRLRPNMQLGYMGRARINELLDIYYVNKTGKTEGFAISFYEDALTFMLANNEDGSKNRDIVGAYSYFLRYYVAKDDKPAIIDTAKKILTIDPNDEQAKYVLKTLNVRF